MTDKKEPKIVHTIKLMYPVEYGEEKLTKLDFIKCETRHMRNIKTTSQSMGDFLDMASQLTGIPPSIIDLLDPKDSLNVIEYVNTFFSR